MELKSLLEDIKRVKINKLKMHPKNPRKGDVNVIAESLRLNGQFRPIVVQKSTKYIIAGNHTVRAAQKLGWKVIDVTYLDVDDLVAKKILLADNRTQDAAGYDYELLAEIISELPDIEGTGYTETDRDFLTQSIQAASEDTDRTVAEVVHETPSFGIIEPKTEVEYTFDEQAGEEATSGFIQPDVNTDKDKTVDSLNDVSSDLEGILDLKTDIIFPIKNYWGIPELRREMLLEELPDNIEAWAGPDATEVKDGVHYVYNYGVDSARGLPWDRAILSFYTHDVHFENWWSVPAHYAAKVINAGVKMAIAPNFSIFLGDPRVIQLWQVYRTRWMGRYLQEAGVKVIPDVNFPDEESGKFAMEGIPKNPPVVAMQWQSLRPHEVNTIRESQLNTRKAIDFLKPGTLLVYGSKTGHKAVKDMELKDIEIVYVMNRASVRRGKVFDHKKGYDITKSDESDDGEIDSKQARRDRRKTEKPHEYGTQLGRAGE